MSRRNHQHTAWAWLKDALVEQLGPDAADQLWAEYARRAHLDKRHNDRVDAPEVIAKLEARMGRADSAEQKRLTKRISRLRALVEEGNDRGE
jgi:hypothetical protein